MVWERVMSEERTQCEAEGLQILCKEKQARHARQGRLTVLAVFSVTDKLNWSTAKLVLDSGGCSAPGGLRRAPSVSASTDIAAPCGRHCAEEQLEVEYRKGGQTGWDGIGERVAAAKELVPHRDPQFYMHFSSVSLKNRWLNRTGRKTFDGKANAKKAGST